MSLSCTHFASSYNCISANFKVIVLIFNDTYVIPKIHIIQKKKKNNEKIHQWGGKPGDIYGIMVYIPTQIFIYCLVWISSK